MDMRLQDAHASCPINGRLRSRALRPVREGSVDSVQRLDCLALGAGLDLDIGAGPNQDIGTGLGHMTEGDGPEEWPMNRDLTLSTPLKSAPIIDLEPDSELPLKTNSVSLCSRYRVNANTAHSLKLFKYSAQNEPSESRLLQSYRQIQELHHYFF